MNRRLEEALNVLGVSADSDRECVTNAYRRLARATHPDVSPDPDAAERFAVLSAAYRLVSAASGHSRSSGRAADSGLLLGVSPSVRAASWGRPPIVAGPVMVQRAQGDAERVRRDGGSGR